MLLGLPLVEMLGVVNKIGCLRCTNQMRGKGCELENTLSVFCVNQEMSFFFLSGKRMWTGPLFLGERIISLKDIIQFSTFFFGCVSGTWPHGPMASWVDFHPNSTYRGFEALSDLRNQVGGCDSMAAWCWQPPTKKTPNCLMQTGWRIQVTRCFKSMWWWIYNLI